MTIDSSAMRLRQLRLQSGIIDTSELASTWAELSPISIEELLGPWRGGLFDTGHPFNRRNDGPRWYGKHFVSADDAKPDICIDDGGRLYATGTAGSLWMVEFRGQLTAALVYDDQPVLDHFKRVDDTSALGIMNRRVDRETDTWLYFWLEREDPSRQIDGSNEAHSPGNDRT